MLSLVLKEASINEFLFFFQNDTNIDSKIGGGGIFAGGQLHPCPFARSAPDVFQGVSEL